MAKKEKKLKAIERMKESWGVSESDLLDRENKKEIARWVRSKDSCLLQWYCGKRTSVTAGFFFFSATKKEMLKVLSNFIHDSTDDQLTVWDPKGKDRRIKITALKLV